jgi:hypothetical protein
MLIYHTFSMKLVCALRCLWSDKNKLYANTCLLVNSAKDEQCRYYHQILLLYVIFSANNTKMNNDFWIFWWH